MSQERVPWSQGQLKSLLRVYADQLAEDPDDIELRLKMAETLRLLGKIDHAVSLYGSAAWSHAVSGNLAQAIVLCKVILTLRPEHSQTQTILARLYASKRIRDAKKGVAVENVDGRWVADPTRSVAFAKTSEEDVPAVIASAQPKLADMNLLGGDAQPSRRKSSRPVVGIPPEPRFETEEDDLAPPLEPTLIEDVDALAPTVVDEEEAPASSSPTLSDDGEQLEQDDTSPPTHVEVPKSRRKKRGTRPLQVVASEAEARRDSTAVDPPRGRALEVALASSAAPALEAPPTTQDLRLDVAGEAHFFRTQEGLAPPERLPRTTKPMPAAQLTTMLRKDAEIAYTEGRPTLGYAAIRRHVAGQAQEQFDTEPMDDRSLDERMNALVRREDAVDDEQAALDLPQLPLFSHLEREAFISLVERLEARVYHPGELVIAEGDAGDTLLLVGSGSLLVFKEDDEREIPLARLEGGSFFGEFALLTDQRRHASVRCETECEILVMRRAMLAELIRDYPTVQETLRAFYERRVLQMVLATSPLFQAVPQGEREALVEEFSTQRLAEGEVVVSEGQEGHAFYVVLIGELAVSCADADSGEAVEVGRLQEGDYFGEMSLISGYAAEATVRATRVTEVLALEGKTFYEMASTHPEIWAEVQRESEARARANESLLANRRRARTLLL